MGNAFSGMADSFSDVINSNMLVRYNTFLLPKRRNMMEGLALQFTKPQNYQQYSTFYLNYKQQCFEDTYIKITGKNEDTEDFIDLPTILIVEKELHPRDSETSNNNVAYAKKICFMSPVSGAPPLFSISRNQLVSDVYSSGHKLGYVKEVDTRTDSDYTKEKIFRVTMPSQFVDTVFNIVPLLSQTCVSEAVINIKKGNCLYCQSKSNLISKYVISWIKTIKQQNRRSIGSEPLSQREVVGTISYGKRIELDLLPSKFLNKEMHNPFKALLLAAAVIIFEQCFKSCCYCCCCTKLIKRRSFGERGCCVRCGFI